MHNVTPQDIKEEEKRPQVRKWQQRTKNKQIVCTERKKYPAYLYNLKKEFSSTTETGTLSHGHREWRWSQVKARVRTLLGDLGALAGLYLFSFIVIPSKPSPGQLELGVSFTSRTFCVFVLKTCRVTGRLTEFCAKSKFETNKSS